MRGPALAALVSLSLSGAALAPTVPARAGAWTQVPGEGIIILSSGRRVAPIGALTGAPADHDTATSQIYLEYGLLDGLTIGAKLYVKLSPVDETENAASIEAFARKRLWRSERGGVASVELGYAHPAESLFGDLFAAADPGAVRELRLSGLYGRSWWGEWGSAFLALGAGYQRREVFADELRSEVTAGLSPWPRWQGMVSLFGLAPLGAGTEASLKIAPSLAYTRREREGEEKQRPVTLQVGLSYDLLNPDDGLGFSVSIWRRF